MDMFFKAVEFATRMHHQQRRKSSTDPYIVHPIRVGYLAIDAGLCEEACAAAVLHDCIEDCDVESSDLINFGISYEVTYIVCLLTKWWPDSVTKEEKANFMFEYYAKILGDKDAVNIKLLDRIDNLRDMLLLLPKQTRWVEKYLEKTKKEFPPLYKASDNDIIKTAYDGIIELVEKRLKEVKNV